MYKKIILATVIVATSSTFAGVGYTSNNTRRMYDKDFVRECDSHEFVSAPYLGLNVGVRSNITGSGTSNTILYGHGAAVYQGIEGTISGGYALTFQDRWYLAFELFGADSTKSRNVLRYGSTYVGVQSNWSYGFDFIPGVVVTDGFLLYLRVGGIGTNFNNINIVSNGWQIGVGGQANLTRNWDIRGEYVSSGYNSVSAAVNKIVANQFNVGVVYKFA